MITAMLAWPELDRVKLFEAGVEPDNVAFRQCLEAAALGVRVPDPDARGCSTTTAPTRERVPTQQDDQSPVAAWLTPHRAR